MQGIANDGFTLLRLGPGRHIDAAKVIDALIERDDRQRSKTTKLGDEIFSKIRGTGFPNPRANAFQTLQPIHGDGDFRSRRESPNFQSAIRSLRAFEEIARFVRDSDGLVRNQ